MIHTIAILEFETESRSSVGDGTQSITRRFKVEINTTPEPQTETPPEETPNEVVISEYVNSRYSPLERNQIESYPRINSAEDIGEIERSIGESAEERAETYIDEPVMNKTIIWRSNEFNFHYYTGQ